MILWRQHFFKDYAHILLIYSFINTNINVDKRNELNEELTNFMLEISESEIYTEEQADKLLDIEYRIEKESMVVNSISLLVIIAYFVIFQFLNNGQTIGKKLLKLKVISDNNKKINILQIVLRTIIIYCVITELLNLIFINVFDKMTYLEISSTINMIRTIFIIVSMLFILYRKDKKGLHDLMSKTHVIYERGN